jgi:hypothetical protein
MLTNARSASLGRSWVHLTLSWLLLSLAASGCAKAGVAADSRRPAVSTESGERVACGAHDDDLACCPIEWKAGGRCSPKAESQSCWTSCSSLVHADDGGLSSNRAQLQRARRTCV